jgi:hypothetical protein
MKLGQAVKKFPEFSDTDGLDYRGFIPPRQRVTGQFYAQNFADFARCSSEEAAPQEAATAERFLHHDNAPSDIRLLCGKSSALISQPPYS